MTTGQHIPHDERCQLFLMMNYGARRGPWSTRGGAGMKQTARARTDRGDARAGVPRPVWKTSEVVAFAVARDIVEHGLRSGDRLPLEAEMVEQYGVSRESLREALRLLEAQGIVSIRRGPGGGPRRRRGVVDEPGPHDDAVLPARRRDLRRAARRLAAARTAGRRARRAEPRSRLGRRTRWPPTSSRSTTAAQVEAYQPHSNSLHFSVIDLPDNQRAGARGRRDRRHHPHPRHPAHRSVRAARR